jgi:hypothetical protein
MGKNKKIRNWKARQVVNGALDDKETKELEACVVIDDAQVSHESVCNIRGLV